jgi:cytochrome oxidase Cu insertion factor (SCO1/SenC/PrrC family)
MNHAVHDAINQLADEVTALKAFYVHCGGACNDRIDRIIGLVDRLIMENEQEVRSEEFVD